VLRFLDHNAAGALCRFGDWSDVRSGCFRARKFFRRISLATGPVWADNSVNSPLSKKSASTATLRPVQAIF
jgi:hypothetical protein